MTTHDIPLEQRYVPPITPIYLQQSPNEPIPLGSFEAALGSPDGDRVRGKARLRFTPRRSAELVIPAPRRKSVAQTLLSIVTPVGKSVTVHLPTHGTVIDTYSKYILRSSDAFERLVLIPRYQPVQVYPASTSIVRAVFHLMNWPDFFGPESYHLRTGTNGFRLCGRFTLEFGGWKVTVAATGETPSAVAALEEKGGYIITHVGQIERIDGGPFSTEQLEETLTFLTCFFSFVLGRWSSPCLSVGFDASGKRVYEEWGIRRCADGPWHGFASWFDSRHAELFPQVLPGFWKLWSCETWNDPLARALGWYMEANQAASGLGVDSALIFSQLALELLSWTYCVLDRRMVSADAFNQRRLSAADKLRLLVRSLDIPLEIPETLSALHARPGRRWEDSMEAITDLRNGLVHPGRDQRVSPDAYCDAWLLSMWYLDLVLLRLCGHRGNYANRLLLGRWEGEVEPVPWSSQQPAGQSEA